MKTPVVDQEPCIGCEACAGLCPEVFEMRDKKSWVIGPDRCSTCDCEEAVESCPVGAFALVE
ncbi:MAG: ferredoxin [Deltaproteobacteria bacterium RIFOXYD12_FULL_57_12]|nr:MAG: ferredoxin [Deltaproteobacteria bacterium RIFOXYD12_FULL_57_12]